MQFYTEHFQVLQLSQLYLNTHKCAYIDIYLKYTNYPLVLVLIKQLWLFYKDKIKFVQAKIEIHFPDICFNLIIATVSTYLHKNLSILNCFSKQLLRKEKTSISIKIYLDCIIIIVRKKSYSPIATQKYRHIVKDAFLFWEYYMERKKFLNYWNVFSKFS